MKLKEFNRLDTRRKIAHLRKCNSRHETLEGLFACDSCSTVLQIAVKT